MAVRVNVRFLIVCPPCSMGLGTATIAMRDDQSRCEGRVTAIKAVAQDISTGKDALCARAILSRDGRHGSISTIPAMSAVGPLTP
jgi:hypothetical protein